jgi:2-alkenal reductase
MSRKLMIAVLLAASLVLAACQDDGASLPAQATPSTPVAALPVNVSLQQRQAQAPTPVGDEVIAEADAEFLLLTNLYDRTVPSVVNVEVIVESSQLGILDTGSGSGFVFDTNGHIITNAHVVNGATNIYVTFNDGYVAQAEVTGIDLFSDLAVIEVDVDTERLIPLTLGDSSGVQVGQRAIAIGNPFGLTGSMTVGIVSGLGRQLRSAELIDSSVIPGFQNPNIIQVDTDINPGNSGGPLLNSEGEVIGVNTAIRTETGTFQGVGFAVPSNTVQRVVPELIASGAVDYSWIGISSNGRYDLANIAEDLELPVSSGVLVADVVPESPAGEAGLQGGSREVIVRGFTVCTGGDIIVAVDEVFIDNMDEFVSYLITNTVPGDTITLLIVRDGETFEIPVTLASRSDAVGITTSCAG